MNGSLHFTRSIYVTLLKHLHIMHFIFEAASNLLLTSVDSCIILLLFCEFVKRSLLALSAVLLSSKSLSVCSNCRTHLTLYTKFCMNTRLHFHRNVVLISWTETDGWNKCAHALFLWITDTCSLAGPVAAWSWTARIRGAWVRIPPEAWIHVIRFSVCCVVCVSRGHAMGRSP